MKLPKIYIGALSKNIADALVSCQSKYFPGIIISRRQVDFDGGYSYDWTTESFSSFLKTRNSHIVVCRDHGGPLQGVRHDDGDLSFICDSNFLDIIHIDPFLLACSIQEAADYTVYYMNLIFNKNPHVKFEIGTEEAIFKYSPSQLDSFISHISNNVDQQVFDNIIYAVIQSGTSLCVPSQKNSGSYNLELFLQFQHVVDRYGLYSKEHNGDYLTMDYSLRARFKLGLNSINIAPEYGQIETSYYIHKCSTNKVLFDTLYRLCLDSKFWKKWTQSNYSYTQSQIIFSSCHYILNSNKFKKLIKSNFPEADHDISAMIKDRIIKLYDQTL